MKEPMKVGRVKIEGSAYSDGTHVLMFGQYEHDGSLAVMLQTTDGQPQATVSVLLDDFAEEGTFFAKNYSENDGLPEALANAGVIEHTGLYGTAGMMRVPKVRLLEPYATIAAEYMKGV